MSVSTYDELKSHIGHSVMVVGYTDTTASIVSTVPWNVAIECETCGCVLVAYDHPLVSQGTAPTEAPPEGSVVDLPTCTCAACTKTQVVVPLDEPPLDDYDCRACGHSMYLHQDGAAQCDVAGCTCTTWCDPTIFGMCDEDHSIFADEPAQYSDDPVVPPWPGLYLLASVTDHCGEEGLCWYHCSDAPTHLSKAEAQIEALAQAMESEVG